MRHSYEEAFFKDWLKIYKHSGGYCFRMPLILERSYFCSENHSSLEIGIHSIELIWNTKCYVIFHIAMIHKCRRLHNFVLHGLRIGDLCFVSALTIACKKRWWIVRWLQALIFWLNEGISFIEGHSTPVGKVINIRNYVLR